MDRRNVNVVQEPFLGLQSFALAAAFGTFFFEHIFLLAPSELNDSELDNNELMSESEFSRASDDLQFSRVSDYLKKLLLHYNRVFKLTHRKHEVCLVLQTCFYPNFP